MGCGVWGVECGVWGVGCEVGGVGCGVWGSRIGVEDPERVDRPVGGRDHDCVSCLDRPATKRSTKNFLEQPRSRQSIDPTVGNTVGFLKRNHRNPLCGWPTHAV